MPTVGRMYHSRLARRIIEILSLVAFVNQLLVGPRCGALESWSTEELEQWRERRSTGAKPMNHKGEGACPPLVAFTKRASRAVL